MMEFWGYLAELVTRSDERNIDFVTGCHQAPVAPHQWARDSFKENTPATKMGGVAWAGLDGERGGSSSRPVSPWSKYFKTEKRIAPDQFSPFSPLPRRYWVRVSPQPFSCLLRFPL